MSRTLSWLPILALGAAALILGALGASQHWDERDTNILFFAAWCAAMLLLFVFGLRLPPRIPGSRFRAMLFNIALAAGAIVIACLANVAVFRHDVFLDVSREAANTPPPQLESVLDGLRTDVSLFYFYNHSDANARKAKELLTVASRQNRHFQFQAIDLDKEPAKAREFGVRAYNTALLQAEGRRVVVENTVDLAQMAFAALRVLKKQVDVVCFVSGHGEVVAEGPPHFHYSHVETLKGHEVPGAGDILQARRARPLDCVKVLMPADKWPRSWRTQPTKVNHKASLRSRMRGVVWRMARGLAGAVLLLAGICAAAAPAAAHQVNISTARVEVRPDRVVAVEVALKGSDVDRVTGTHVFDEQAGTVDAAKVAAAAAPIAAYIGAHVSVTGADSAPCAAGAPEVTADGDGVITRNTFSCAKVAGGLVYHSTVLTAANSSARQVVLLGSGPDAAQALLDETNTTVALSVPPPSLLSVMQRYIVTGIEHIFLGYDHIAFLIAIVLWARRLLPVIKIVTAFTLAHSITLSLAALQIVVIPSTIVEPAIAASIVFVALENFFSRDIDGRWKVTFAFGLIHGFGFASALQEFGLPANAVVPALAAFNIGVEIGQVAIVSIVVPVLVLLDRIFAADRTKPVRAAALVYALSALITVLGSYWLLTRIFEA